MEYNDRVIEALRRSFNPPFRRDDGRYNVKSPFTNCSLVFAYNGTGKTRLSYDFAHYGRKENSLQHTLYYNAYTEDLFVWDNHIEIETDNRQHQLMINKKSALIRGLAGYNFAESLRKYLGMFTDIDFTLKYDKDDIPDYITFSKNQRVKINGVWNDVPIEDIKISRGEERLFVWCFFRCIIDQVIGGNDAYKNIEYIYIDDPMSSLDDNNVILFAEQLYKVIRKQMEQELKDEEAKKGNYRRIKFIVSTHHALFFHTMLHGLNKDKRLGKFYLTRNKQKDQILLKKMSDDTPFYYNVAMMSEIKKAIQTNKLYTFHFTVLRSVMEKIKEFFGHRDFSIILDGIKYKGESILDQEEMAEFYSRVVNVLTHQGSMFTPALMNEDNKDLAKSIFDHLVEKYQFVLPDLTDFRSEKEIFDEKNKE